MKFNIVGVVEYIDGVREIITEEGPVFTIKNLKDLEEYPEIDNIEELKESLRLVEK